MNERKTLEFGFTLWEILLAMVILGITLTIISPHFSSAPKQVQNYLDAVNRQTIQGAVQLYRIDVGKYPEKVLDLLNPNGASGWKGPYLDNMPVNPFNTEQGYKINSMGQVL